MGRLSIGCLAVALCAGQAAACINDVELPNHEREFRSQYREQPAPPPVPPAPPSNDYWPAVGGGLAMLVGGAAVGLFVARPRG